MEKMIRKNPHFPDYPDKARTGFAHVTVYIPVAKGWVAQWPVFGNKSGQSFYENIVSFVKIAKQDFYGILISYNFRDIYRDYFVKCPIANIIFVFSSCCNF